jgi:programmed cell death 6-interacting protein
MPTVFSKQLATHCKKTEGVDLKGPLLAYIKATYNSKDAEDAADDLATIQTLRSEVATASANASQPGLRESLAKWVGPGFPAASTCHSDVMLL